MILLNASSSFWDENIYNLIEKIKETLPESHTVRIAQQIAAILALIYFAYRAYMMMVGEGKFDISQLMRPFLISMAIINFSTVIDIISLPGKQLDETGKANMIVEANVVNNLFDQKQALSDSLFTTLIENTNEIKKGMDKNAGMDDRGIIDYVTAPSANLTYDLMSYITIYEQLLYIKVKMFLQGMITQLVIAIFKGIVYCIFFLQMILLFILSALGPFSFAFSLAGPFKNAWATWIARYITVTFYSMIAFIVVNISLAIIEYGFSQEIDRMKFILKQQQDDYQKFLAIMLNLDNFIGFLFIAIVVAIAGIMAIPTASSWIIGTASTGGAFVGGVGRTVKGAGKAAAAVATNGASAVAGAWK